MISISKALKHAINLLRFLWQINLHQKLANRHIQRVSKVGELAHEAAHHSMAELIPTLGQN